MSVGNVSPDYLACFISCGAVHCLLLREYLLARDRTQSNWDVSSANQFLSVPSAQVVDFLAVRRFLKLPVGAFYSFFEASWYIGRRPRHFSYGCEGLEVFRRSYLIIVGDWVCKLLRAR